MKITEYILTASASDESDGVGVDVTQEEGHHSIGKKVMGIDVAACNAKDGTYGVAGKTEHRGELVALYGAPFGDCTNVSEGCGIQGSAGTQVADLEEEAQGSADVGVAGQAVSNLLPADGIFNH